LRVGGGAARGAHAAQCAPQRGTAALLPGRAQGWTNPWLVWVDRRSTGRKLKAPERVRKLLGIIKPSDKTKKKGGGKKKQQASTQAAAAPPPPG